VVRSTAAAARLATEPLDLGKIATEVAGDRIRVNAQLVEARSGTLVGSHSVEPALGDLIRLHDDVTKSIVDFLSPTLSGGEKGTRREVAATPRAYELYLRAVEAVRDYRRFEEVRDLFARCVEEDPGFAPAWAQLGRCHRLIGKYVSDREENTRKAEEAFARALEADPGLPLAHKYLAHHEAETGRATEAMVRLLRVAEEHRNDAAVFAGLVHSCRYAGLLEASMGAHDESRRLDPRWPTSIPWTLLARAEYERLASLDRDESTEFDMEPQILGMALLGRIDEGHRLLDEQEARDLPEVLRAVTGWVRPFLEHDPEAVRAAVQRALAAFHDPEASFMYSLILFRTGQVEEGLELLESSVRGGFNATTAMAEEPSFDPMRGDPRFEALREHAAARRAEALAAYRAAGGERLLGI
jgi:tetratricopeptide (TPR) repeat protein